MHNIPTMEEFKELFKKFLLNKMDYKEGLELVLVLDELRYKLMDECHHHPERIKDLYEELGSFSDSIEKRSNESTNRLERYSSSGSACGSNRSG